MSKNYLSKAKMTEQLKWLEEHQTIHSDEVENKRLRIELTILKQQLAIAVEALGLIDKRKCHMANCLQNCPLRKYYEKDNGCATCLNKACHIALQQIKELENE